MQTTAVNNLAHAQQTLARSAGRLAGAPDFAHALRGAAADQARQAARSLVAITLVQPVLDQIKNDPFKSDLFHGGFGEDVFASQLHATLAERIVQRSDLPIVDAVYRQITRASAAPAPHSPAPDLEPQTSNLKPSSHG